MSETKRTSRLLTLVFTDVVDSTALKAKRGDFRAEELLTRHRAHVERIAKQHSGRIIDWAGDGCFLTFETSSEAVLFAVELQREHLSDLDLPAIRVGIHMGEVTELVRADGTVRVEGLTVDLTARLESLAHPNQIVMSEAVYKSARQRLRHRESELTLIWKQYGEFHLKGFDEPIEVCVAGLGENAPLDAPVRSEKAWPATSPAKATAVSDEDDLRLLRRLFRRPQGVAAFVVLVLAVVGGMIYIPTLQKNKTEGRMKWARDVVPEIQKSMQAGDFKKAYELATEADKYIDDMLLDQLIGQTSGELSFVTSEPGAQVSYKPYNEPNSPWQSVGKTPIAALHLPLGIYRWRVELDGYATREFVRPVFPRGASEFAGQDSAVYNLQLAPVSPETDGMSFVEGSVFFPSITGIGIVEYNIDSFFIDITEVTNAAYREFVEAGGYTDPKFWTEPFELSSEILSFDDAKKRFVDSTGRPGPASWVMGDFPAGKENYPVQGVSWYEAMAYAKFRGKMLPTFYHWARAAFPIMEAGMLVLTPQMIAYSNLESDGPIPVASTPDLSSTGTYNMAGNVREWCLNARGNLHFTMGGKWDEPEYILFSPTPLDSWDRTEGNGFRCMRMPDGAQVQEEFLKPLGEYTFEANRKRYTPETLRSTLAVFATPARTDYAVKIESTDTTPRHYNREKLSIAGVGDMDSRLPIELDTPKTGKGPWPVVIFQPGMDSLYVRDPHAGLADSAQFLTQTDRILVRPILAGMYYRNTGNTARQFAEAQARGVYFRTWIQELNQTVAYLKTRPDVDPNAISFYGISLGATIGVVFGAENKDVKSVILALAGLPPLMKEAVNGIAPLIEEYATLIRQPVLMLNGRYDFLMPVEESQNPLFNRLAADPAHKKHVLYDEGHSLPSQSEVIREVTAWLDQYEHGVPESPAAAVETNAQ